MTMRSVYKLPVLLLAFLFLLTGCDSTEDEPDVLGTYETESFMAVIDGETVNVLAQGGFVEMTLRADMTVDGRLFVPEPISGDEGFDTDVDLEGTYSVSGSEVTFMQEEDTFVRDVTWRYENDRLSTEFGEASIVLRKE